MEPIIFGPLVLVLLLLVLVLSPELDVALGLLFVPFFVVELFGVVVVESNSMRGTCLQETKDDDGDDDAVIVDPP